MDTNDQTNVDRGDPRNEKLASFDREFAAASTIKSEKAARRHRSIHHGESNDHLKPKDLTSKPLHKYKFQKSIAQGGMKTIIKVRDRDTLRNVAMAVMGDDDPDQVEEKRFIREARITANLEHPNIVPIHDMGADQEGTPYFTMKLLRGETLSSVIRNLKKRKPEYERKYTLPHLLQILQKICDAVAFAHSRGIIHLDLKPENIQIGDYGEVLVLDWGLSKYVSASSKSDSKSISDEGNDERRRLILAMDGEMELTVDGEIKGTFGFMAPEQAAGQNSSKDERTDVYALGAILYSLLTLEKPLAKRDDVEEMIADTIEGRVIPPSERTPQRSIPDALEAVTRKAMALRPHDRYQNVEALSCDLEAFVTGYATAAEKAGVIKHLTLFLKRRRSEARLVGVVLFFFVVLSGFWLRTELKRSAAWGKGEDITPKTEQQFIRDWIANRGNWKLQDGRLVAAPGNGDFFELYYRKPIYGKIAIEFDAMIDDVQTLGKGGDLSVILADGKDSTEGYFLQLGGVGNTSGVIKRRGGFSSMVNFSLESGRAYHIRAEKEEDTLRLYCDGRLVLSARDIFYLEGGRVGLYTYGPGKRFWNIKLHHRGMPELVSPLLEGDAFYRESRSKTGSDRDLFLRLSRDAYGAVHESHPGKDLGRQALLKRAYVNVELGDLAGAETDIASIASLDDDALALDVLLLQGEIAFRRGDFEEAFIVYNRAINNYPNAKIEIAGNLTGKLTPKAAGQMSPELLQLFWRICAKNHSSSVFRCRNRRLDSVGFLRGMKFSLLDCCENQIESLIPLTDMPLRHLDCAQNKIQDLAPLRGMRLVTLECFGNPIESLEPLRGMPLKELIIHDCPKIKDLSPLLDCPSLEKLTIPAKAENVEDLKSLPNLNYLDDHWDGNWKKTSKRFWAERQSSEPLTNDEGNGEE